MQWKAISARPSVTLDIIRNLPCQRFSEEPLKRHRHHELSPTITCISAGADYFAINIFFNCLFRIKDHRQITASIIKARIIKCVDVLARFHRNSGRIAFAKKRLGVDPALFLQKRDLYIINLSS